MNLHVCFYTKQPPSIQQPGRVLNLVAQNGNPRAYLFSADLLLSLTEQMQFSGGISNGKIIMFAFGLLFLKVDLEHIFCN